MIWRTLADLALLLHVGFIVFVIVGGFLAIRWPQVAWFHLPALIWGVTIEFAGWICPLTPLETWLLRAGGETGYRGGFIEHYGLMVIYPTGLTPQGQWFLGASLLLVNLLAYALFYRKWLKDR